jgi:hypothetical protein
MTTTREDDRVQQTERGVFPEDTKRSESFSKSTLHDQQHLEHVEHNHEHADKAAPAVKLEGEAAMRAPEWIRKLSVEERHAVEGKLKRKLDTRLMPMIVLMYIMNYLDRVRMEFA